jgi:hypothetical protein
MASITGVNFGTVCDHLVRRRVYLYLDTTLQPPFSTTEEEFWCRVDSDIDTEDSQFSLFVNQEEVSIIARVGFPDEHLVIFTAISGEGFGLGGFGEGGFGLGGFNIGINIESLGNYPGDEIELQYRTRPRHCPKCVLKDGDGSIVKSTTLAAYSNRGYGIPPYGSEPYG